MLKQYHIELIDDNDDYVYDEYFTAVYLDVVSQAKWILAEAKAGRIKGAEKAVKYIISVND